MIDKEFDLTNILIGSAESIASDLINAFNLKHGKEIKNLSENSIRWIDFRLRYVDPKPRRVVLSTAFPKQLPSEIETALNEMISRIENGVDINPFQGKGLIQFHDTSGRKKQNRTDLLWADWGVLHFHLSDGASSGGGYFSKRSDWLLFGIIAENEFGIIDICHHKSDHVFADNRIFQIMCDSWPVAMASFQINGILPPTESRTPEEIELLRKSGIMGLTTVGGKVYGSPGMGISSAATSLKVRMVVDRMTQYIKQLAKDILSEENEFQRDCRSNNISNPNFSLIVTEKGLCVFEENLNRAWILPQMKSGLENSYLAQMTNLLAPAWAISRLMEMKSE